MDSETAMHVEANGFINLQLFWDKAENKRVVSPTHYVVMWSSREKSGKLRYTSSLLSIRLIEEADLPESVEAGIEVRGRDGYTTTCGGQYIEFQLLAQPCDLPKQTPLAIVAGPVRVNADTDLREFMRIDMGKCLRDILSDVIDDVGRRGQLSRRRWYICVEVMRLICSANSLDCTALDQPDVPPLEWVLCLSDERVAQALCPEMAHLQDKSIDELTRFIVGSKKGKAKKKKGKEEEERPPIPEPPRPVFPEGTRWQLPLGWMDQAEDQAAHLRHWRDLGACKLATVNEANRYLRLELGPADHNRLRATPASCVLAFPRNDVVKRMSEAEMLGASNVQFFSTLLSVFVFSNDEIRDPGKEWKCPPSEVGKGNLVFELLVRVNDCNTPPPLRFSSGPCNPNSRVDMSRTVQWTEPELVQLTVDGHIEPVIRMRWWINVDVLQVVCKSNGIDCTGLERSDVEPFEWLCCVYDDGFPGAPAMQESNWAFRNSRKSYPGPSVVPAPAAAKAAVAVGAAKPVPSATKPASKIPCPLPDETIERAAKNLLAGPMNAKVKESAETRSIEDLLDFIDGKADDALRELKEEVGSKKTRKKREKEPIPLDAEGVQAALFDLMSNLGQTPLEEPVPASAAPSLGAPSLEKAAAASVAAAAAAASGDPVAQVKAAAELLAQAAAQSNSPRKFAAALAAAQLAAEPPQPSTSSRAPTSTASTAGRAKKATAAQAKLGASRVDNTNLHSESESEDSLSSPHEELPGLSASKALAASLSSRARVTPPGECTGGSANASFRDGLLRVSGIDAGGGLDLQGLLLSSLRENFAQAQNQVAATLGKEPSQPPAAASHASPSASAEPRRAPRKRR